MYFIDNKAIWEYEDLLVPFDVFELIIQQQQQ
ncbi:hypothetical protein T01_7763 [Trichinella spiralis]|uniref:Uncharacterized protein n=1 Tax=Trichinella spiralis TaxID=6334 RepID=A0A0V0YRX6_TRISP|nr:hypothetical protein T01_7763 [Trichinella spiralis]